MNFEYKLKITEADSVDLKQLSELHKISFASIFKKSMVSNDYMTPEFYKWKYNPPAGKGVIAVVEKDKQIISCTAMIPVNVNLQNQNFKAWQVVDGATNPQFQANGFFGKCMRALREELKGDDIQFAFPNKNSLDFFFRNQHKLAEKVGFYAKVNFLQSEKAKSVFKNECFNEAVNQFFKKNSSLKIAYINRNVDYLNWRYIQHPGKVYQWHVVTWCNEVTGFAVVRPFFVKGMRILLLLEYFSQNQEAARQLGYFIQSCANNEHCLFTAVYLSNVSRHSFPQSGFVKIPSFFLPKKQVFSIAANDKNHPLLTADWFLQTGDWDAF